ncbi:MAG TPA: hypothetical protein VI541_04460 [Actinomycetota bacterium]|nr:hypothetical protein [Actinomycetota bacterium]
MEVSRKVLGGLSALGLAGLVAAGVIAVGTPDHARRVRADERRSETLQSLDFLLAEHARAHEAQGLPASLDDVDGFANYPQDPREDPITHRRFTYERVSSSRYRICADFDLALDGTDTSSTRYVEPGVGGQFFRHGAGEHCFVVKAQDFPVPGKYPD